MSVSRETTIWCYGCVEWRSTSYTAAHLRSELRTYGWRALVGGKDLCPECIANRRQVKVADVEVGGHDCPCATGYGLACAGCDVAADVEVGGRDAN